MLALLFVPLVAAFMSTSFSDVGKSAMIELMNFTSRDVNKTKALLNRISKDFDSMPKLQNDLSKCQETTNMECSLNKEQKEFLRKLQSLRRKTNSRKENSIELVNTRSRMRDVLFQGDMVLSKEQQDQVIADINRSRPKRQAYNDKNYPGMRWPNGVSYSLDGSKARAVFKKAAELWMNNTCIDFKEDLNETAEDLLLVFKEYGCWAEVGRQGGWQLLSLGGDVCEKTGVAAHEIGHALGFWHTHARHDRNDFITVLRSNVKRDRRKNFARQSWRTNNNYNLTYDYGSVMHYGARTFTKNATGNPAIVPKDVSYMETLGSKIISFYDLLMMNMYYNCTDACKDQKTNCSNGGFPHPRNCSKCICPSGYGGQLCDERPPGCGNVLNANETWKTLTDNIESNETGSDGYTRCNYWIKAPTGRQIEIKILHVPESTFEGCRDTGVEIKAHSDQRLTGYRFCSDTFVNTTLTSNSSLVPVITYSLNDIEEQAHESGKESELEVREVSEEDEDDDEDDEDEEDDEDDENEEYDKYYYDEYGFGDVVIQYRYV